MLLNLSIWFQLGDKNERLYKLQAEITELHNCLAMKETESAHLTTAVRTLKEKQMEDRDKVTTTSSLLLLSLLR